MDTNPMGTKSVETEGTGQKSVGTGAAIKKTILKELSRA